MTTPAEQTLSETIEQIVKEKTFSLDAMTARCSRTVSSVKGLQDRYHSPVHLAATQFQAAQMKIAQRRKVK